MKSSRTDNGVIHWFRSANCDGRYGIALLSTMGLLLLLQACGEPVRAVLQYERSAVQAGQLWRLISAHLVHLNAEHLLLNVAGLVLLWMLCARDFKPSHWLLILLLSALGIDAGLWFAAPQVQWYLGASGLLHAAWAAGAWAALARREQFGVLLLVVLVIKLAFEHGRGSLVAGGLPVVLEAHVYGALSGLLSARLSSWRRKPL
jgi:rhomboid family GlyGly-CTERM serine protease